MPCFHDDSADAFPPRSLATRFQFEGGKLILEEKLHKIMRLKSGENYLLRSS
jgi:hypothetical protein